jgi:capsular exopolysaccharide synthesis family protein
VADATAARLGRGWTGRAVRDAVAVNGDGDSNLVEVSATTPRGPREAARVATTYAQTFVSLQEAANVADVKRRLKVYDDYVNSLPPEERSGPRGQRLQQALDTLRINEALQSDSQKGTAEVVQPAEVPTSPSSPKTVRNVALAIVLGLVIGLALAALVDRLDRAVRTVDELERVYRLPVLARIPRERGFGRRLRQRGAADALRQGAEAEAFRALRANLRYFGDVRSLLIVSPEAEDGKSTVAACLATTSAQRGDRVVLVEADLHKPGGAERVGGPAAGAAPNDLGLSGVLAGGLLDDALVTVPVGDDGRELTVLPSGPPPPNASELLESRRMREVMRELAERYDLVLYDTPAMGAVSDAFALVSDSSGVIVVGRLGHTHRDRARELLKQLVLLRAHVLGVVANYADLPKDGARPRPPCCSPSCASGRRSSSLVWRGSSCSWRRRSGWHSSSRFRSPAASVCSSSSPASSTAPSSHGHSGRCSCTWRSSSSWPWRWSPSSRPAVRPGGAPPAQRWPCSWAASRSPPGSPSRPVASRRATP